MSNACLNFLPWVRQGAAAAITTTDTLNSAQSAVASVTVALTLNGAAVPAMSVRLRGPADVIGIDTNQVLRTDPRPATNDFEPNCFPSIEFDRADFPWLFTPAHANANAQLRPWLCLVVVRKQAGVTLASNPDTPLPALQIAAPASPASELPDLKDCWAWAHAQVAADDSSPSAITAALNGEPELSLSRLVCPRMLAPATDYLACLVPAFEPGRKAGLGLPISDADLIAANALAPAWSFVPTPPPQVLLPIYFHWEFRTAAGGDFASLARRLTPAAPEGIGRRPIDISHPGFPSSSATTVELEGALLPIPPTSSQPASPEADPVPLQFKNELAAIMNEPSRTQAADPNSDPLLAPPIYGRWHAGSASVTPTATAWLDQLNLDPRWRIAAAFGTQVIQNHQEALMASAWEQAAELPIANQRMRQLQLSMAIGEVLHQQHFSQLSEEMMVRIAAPAFGRLRYSTNVSILAQQIGSALPIAANRTAMRRIGRQRGPLSRRVAVQGFTRSPTQTWIVSFTNTVSIPAIPPLPLPVGYCEMPNPIIMDLQHDSQFGAFFVSPENTPIPSQGTPVPLKDANEIPGYFRAAAFEHLKRFFAPRAAVLTPHLDVFGSIKDEVLEQTQPTVALPPLVKAVISTGDNVLPPTAPGVSPVGVETIMTAPSFLQAMYEPLRDLSQELLFPGLDLVKPDTVLGLQTNRRFVEAYMVGLNHEMGRELLWRGYPTDQRGTYFSHFWGLGVPNAAPNDINDLNTWHTRSLGDAASAPPNAEEFVLLLRSSLLQRYPNAVIYLTPAIKAGTPPDPDALVPDELPAHEQLPIFSGSMQPDVAFFGFPVTTTAAVGGPGNGLGYYVVIQEHPTEPRFGLDVGFPLGDASHLAIGANPPQGLALNGRTWGKNAAEMAAITRRLPVRLAIHARRLIAPA